MNRRESFVDRWADIALEISRETGVRPEVILGQSALETGWGAHVPSNNMFGIKGPGTVYSTTEDYGRGLQRERASFRGFKTPEESFRAYGNLRLNGVPIDDIVDPDMTMREQVAAIKSAGYATDKAYVGKVSSLASKIADMPQFQERQKTFQADLIQGMVGVPDYPDAVPDIPGQTGMTGRDFRATLDDAFPSASNRAVGSYDFGQPTTSLVGWGDFMPSGFAPAYGYSTTDEVFGPAEPTPAAQPTGEFYGPDVPMSGATFDAISAAAPPVSTPEAGPFSFSGQATTPMADFKGFGEGLTSPIGATATNETFGPSLLDLGPIDGMKADDAVRTARDRTDALTREVLGSWGKAAPAPVATASALPDEISMASNLASPAAQTAFAQAKPEWGMDSPSERLAGARLGKPALPEVPELPAAGLPAVGPMPPSRPAPQASKPAPAPVLQASKPAPRPSLPATAPLPPARPASPVMAYAAQPAMPGLGLDLFGPAPSLSQGFALAGNSLLGGLTDAQLSGLGYGSGLFSGGWDRGWGDGGPGGYGGGSVYDGGSGPYAGGDARFDGGWGGISDGDTYR